MMKVWPDFASSISAMVLSALVLAACTETRYVDLNSRAQTEEPGIQSRTVEFRIDPEFFAEPQDCVLVLPAKVSSEEVRPAAALVEAALSRHLAFKFDRVVDARMRDIRAREMAIDLTVPGDRKALAESLDCGAFLEIESLKPATDYLLVYSRMELELDVSLSRRRDDHVIWRARTTARRSDGGLATSPFGAVLNGFFSARFAGDAEEANAVISDAVRRIAGSLPDMRRYR